MICGLGFMFNKKQLPFYSVARRRALYGEEWRSMMIPSCAVLPYVSVVVTGMPKP